MDERVSITIEGGVADVRLTRADKMNALDGAMFEALAAAGERLKAEPGLRAVVLSGDGRAFCAGLDMGSFGRMAEGRGATRWKRHWERSCRPHPRHRQSGPVLRRLGVARDPGPGDRGGCTACAFGGGFQLMLGADIRLVA